MSRKVTKWIIAGIVSGIAGTAQAGDFDGMYGGVFARNNFNLPGNVDVGFGAFAGYNMEMDSGIVAGLEGEIEFDPAAPSPPFGGSVWGGADINVAANARVGMDAGGALVYGKIGAGYSTALTGAFWNLGAGADIPVMGDAFIRGEVLRQDPFAAGPVTRYSARVGIGYNF